MQNDASSQSGHSFGVGSLHGSLPFFVLKRAKKGLTYSFTYVVQNVDLLLDLNKNGSNTKMTFEMLQIKHGLAPWGG